MALQVKKQPAHAGRSPIFKKRSANAVNAVRICVAMVAVGCATISIAAEAIPTATADLDFYTASVKPILDQHCNKCHGEGSKFRGGLNLVNRDELLKGGESGPAVDLLQPKESLLLAAVNYNGYQMPPSGKLPDADIAILTEWVKRGVPLPASSTTKTIHHEGPIRPEDHRDHWSFRPVTNPVVPASVEPDWIKSPIDCFIWHKLNEQQIPARQLAPKQQLVRRIYFDLTGLPPTPQAVADFTADTRPDATAKLVDRLLESPEFGEKWARLWLDLVRYGETNSFERDNPKPNVWKYRDYVIDAFNTDKPYGRFLTEQLAGDELPDASHESVIATGFYRLGTWDDEPTDPILAMYDELDDIVTVTGQVMLGLTVNCCRCHDHKLDPIPQADYYRFLSFFQDLQQYAHRHDQMNSPFSQTDISTPEVRDLYTERDNTVRELQAEMVVLEEKGIKTMAAEEQRASEGPDRGLVISNHLQKHLNAEDWNAYTQLKMRREETEKRPLPPRQQALSVNLCLREPRETHILIRGNHNLPGPLVQPGFPSVLGSADPQISSPSNAQSSGRRTALANWMTDTQNPLTYRVWVNRVWQQLFGKGIVRSASNFGLKGDLPTHPELLDWLTTQFLKDGQRLKPLVRQILLSNAYQLSSSPDPTVVAADIPNAYFSRSDLRRLTAEEIRDTTLAVSGQLQRSFGGPSVYPPIPEAILAGQSVPGQNWDVQRPEQYNRRSVYVHIKRSLLVPQLSVFDQPDPDGSCPIRFSTTQPTQALSMLNGEFINTQAKAFATRVTSEVGEETQPAVRHALSLALSREPTAAEIQRGVDLVSFLKNDGLSQADAFVQFCLVVLNVNEFVYLD